MDIQELKTTLSNEWNKPKYKNLRRDKDGKIIDTRIPRDTELIKETQLRIRASKGLRSISN